MQCNYYLQIVSLWTLSGDIELNPGPVSGKCNGDKLSQIFYFLMSKKKF